MTNYDFTNKEIRVNNKKLKQLIEKRLQDTEILRYSLFYYDDGEERDSESLDDEEAELAAMLYEFIFGMLASRPEVKAYKAAHPEAKDTDFIFVDNLTLTEMINRDKLVQKAMRDGKIDPVTMKVNQIPVSKPKKYKIRLLRLLTKAVGIGIATVKISEATGKLVLDKKIPINKTFVESAEEENQEEPIIQKEAENEAQKPEQGGSADFEDFEPEYEEDKEWKEAREIAFRNLKQKFKELIPSLIELENDVSEDMRDAAKEMAYSTLLSFTASAVGNEIIRQNGNKVPRGMERFEFYRKLEKEPAFIEVVEPLIDEIVDAYRQAKAGKTDTEILEMPKLKRFLEMIDDSSIGNAFGVQCKIVRNPNSQEDAQNSNVIVRLKNLLNLPPKKDETVLNPQREIQPGHPH